jgi:hypothetical protein
MSRASNVGGEMLVEQTSPLRIEIVVVLGNAGIGFGNGLAAPDAQLFFAQPAFKRAQHGAGAVTVVTDAPQANLVQFHRVSRSSTPLGQVLA